MVVNTSDLFVYFYTCILLPDDAVALIYVMFIKTSTVLKIKDSFVDLRSSCMESLVALPA
jgi:hypothetical protein